MIGAMVRRASGTGYIASSGAFGQRISGCIASA